MLLLFNINNIFIIMNDIISSSSSCEVQMSLLVVWCGAVCGLLNDLLDTIS